MKYVSHCRWRLTTARYAKPYQNSLRSIKRARKGQRQGFVSGRHDGGTDSFGDVTTPGYAYLKNLDTVNYVQIGVVVSAVFYPLMRLNAGEAAIVPWDSGAVVYAKANAAPVAMVIKTFAR
ncbi:MAG: hypothetical protein KatS3mg038_2410 [Candidatus Kapaibacterium sp.]|nr:MAG: hypothetical protein KatS3mg038_2410 [Candidatus Kapabacteria bacterium]